MAASETAIRIAPDDERHDERQERDDDLVAVQVRSRAGADRSSACAPAGPRPGCCRARAFLSTVTVTAMPPASESPVAARAERARRCASPRRGWRRPSAAPICSRGRAGRRPRPAMRPRYMTAIRSASPSTSSSSVDTSTTAVPLSRSATMRRCTNSIEPTSSPRVGWATMSSFSGRDSSRASTTFCWLPPDSVLAACVSDRRTHVELLDPRAWRCVRSRRGSGCRTMRTAPCRACRARGSRRR